MSEIRNMPCMSDFGPMTPPDDEWLDWLNEDRLVSLGRERYETGMSAGAAALQIAELLDSEEDAGA